MLAGSPGGSKPEVEAIIIEDGSSTLSCCHNQMTHQGPGTGYGSQDHRGWWGRHAGPGIFPVMNTRSRFFTVVCQQ